MPLIRAAPWLAGALAFALAAAVGAGVPAPGGEPLLAAAETADATALGIVEEPGHVDLHGWSARLRVERALAGDLAPGSTVRIAWEELSRGRPARFRDGDRILVALAPLPGASLWGQRFPNRDALAVAARGEAFLRAPDPASVETLASFLALSPEQRSRTRGIESLAEMVSRAQPPLGRAALARLRQLPALDSEVSPHTREVLTRTLADPGRPLPLRQGILSLIAERQLQSLRSAVAPHAAEGSPLEPRALAALATLDGGLPPAQVATLLDSENPALRAVGVRNAPATPSMHRLSALLRTDRDPEVRAAVVDTLLASEGQAAVGPVSAALFDPDARVREAAVRGLASLGAAAVPTLERLVERRTLEEVKTPLAALALAGPAGRAALERVAAFHPDDEVRTLARLFLGRQARPRD